MGYISTTIQPPVNYVQLFILFALLVFISASVSVDNCTVSGCKDHGNGPSVRFPFWLRGRQPDHCGYPGFELSCSENKETVLNLPFSGIFFVKAIDYRSQVIEIYDPHGCIVKRLLNLNFSSSPFQRRYEYVKSYSLFNCSATESGNGVYPINCLRVSAAHPVYAVDSTRSMNFLPPLSSCEKFGNVSVDTKSSYDPNWDLALLIKWKAPDCSKCEAESKACGLNNHTSVGAPTIQCFDFPPQGITIGIVLLVVATLMLIKVYHVYASNKVEKQNQAMVEKFLDDYKALKPSRYSYAEIKRITNNFKDKLGQGGYGSVFKGNLSNDILVAVKVLNNSKGNGEEFINEVGTIGRIHHVNVVRLVGFCADGFRRALVYEFLPNESLEKFIFSRDAKNPSLGWEKLHIIAVGIAKGIDYLHQGCEQRILHFDIKPHNILLDHSLNPKISDFGLAKLCSKDVSVVSMTAARGTMGYIAPEVFSRNFGNVSYKSDVYSFGMLLLEMVGGRKNIDLRAERTSQVYFPEWIYNRLIQGEELEIREDEDGDSNSRIVKKLTTVALWCIQWYPADRPSMKDVVQMLEGDAESLSMPPNPFASATSINTSMLNTKKPLHQGGLTVIAE
ncbi:PREDICTED: rust resistance kinase Lr10-like isoform X2 [Nelumbo nucifera]|uniref:Protein kinase domain-containing protein n=2 Tax=Nelumbo nucifera TaxID=4432 RepID=A0A822XKQ5_NELNU|nr:PREDICTED: rust resistance kinase Lr10-like isoform X2 [Nelumbo nucifera]DAD18128.1 TPA_asm: hypothetical protein HUJ06_019591 [Nelumbo nucifera]